MITVFTFFIGIIAFGNVGKILDAWLGQAGVPSGLFLCVFSLLGALAFKRWFSPDFDGFLGFKTPDFNGWKAPAAGRFSGLKNFLLGFLIQSPVILHAGWAMVSNALQPGALATITSPLQYGVWAANTSPLPAWLWAIIKLVSIALYEEIAFRGVLISCCMKEFRSYNRPGLAVLLSGIFFGAIHWINITAGQAVNFTLIQTINSASTGVLYSLAFMVTGSVWPGFFVHFLYNYSYIAVNGGDTVTAEYTLGELMPLLATSLGIFALTALAAVALLSRKGLRTRITALWQRKWNM